MSDVDSRVDEEGFTKFKAKAALWGESKDTTDECNDPIVAAMSMEERSKIFQNSPPLQAIHNYWSSRQSNVLTAEDLTPTPISAPVPGATFYPIDVPIDGGNPDYETYLEYLKRVHGDDELVHYSSLGLANWKTRQTKYIHDDPFIDDLIEKGTLKDSWPYAMSTLGGMGLTNIPIRGLKRKILSSLLRGGECASTDDYFSEWKDRDLTEFFDEIRDMGDGSFEQFYDAFQKHSCSDWAKMTRDGECFGGPWRADPDTEEHERAYFLCWEDNARALWELGHPLPAIMYAVEYLCPFRCEGVAEVRDLCKWVLDLPIDK